jgi:hypothetical protein
LDRPHGPSGETVVVIMSTLVWVLVAWFVWYSSATVWQADIRLGYFDTKPECEAAGAQLDLHQRYSWEGMEGGPAWLRHWACEGEEAGAAQDGSPVGVTPTRPSDPVLARAPAPN